MYEYRILDNVYKDIISHKKKIEFRLLNDKASKIQINDLIRFITLDNKNKVIVKVTNKYIFDTVDELFENEYMLSNISLSKEEFKKALVGIFGENYIDYKIVGIEFEIED